MHHVVFHDVGKMQEMVSHSTSNGDARHNTLEAGTLPTRKQMFHGFSATHFFPMYDNELDGFPSALSRMFHGNDRFEGGFEEDRPSQIHNSVIRN